MSAKAEKLLRERTAALVENLKGRANASSSTLSRSYGLPVAEVAKILRSMGVRDDG